MTSCSSSLLSQQLPANNSLIFSNEFYSHLLLGECYFGPCMFSVHSLIRECVTLHTKLGYSTGFDYYGIREEWANAFLEV